MKKTISILLLFAILTMLAGCDGEIYDLFIPEKPTQWEDTEQTDPLEQTSPADQTEATEQTKLTVPTIPENTQPETDYPEIGDLISLRDFMNSQLDADILEFSFAYTGSETLSARLIAQMTSTCYISYQSQGNVYYVTVTEYPGDRMVDAYFSGDTSALNADERKALNMALDMLAKVQASDTWELEVQIHDMLAEHITYSDGSREFNDPSNPPRNLTAVGALLDGKANCQGYTDAFYTLASIAGFRVGRMSVYTPDDLHMVNTIYLDGAWYVVDVTFDDQDASGVTNYRLFNVGTDLIREYTWDTEKEIHLISWKSGRQSYYLHEGIVYDDLETMACSIAAQWSSTGNTTYRAMLRNESDGMKLDEALYDVLMETGKSFSYRFWYYSNDHDTYYTVVFAY